MKSVNTASSYVSIEARKSKHSTSKSGPVSLRAKPVDMVCPMRFVLAGISALVALLIWSQTSWSENELSDSTRDHNVS